MNHRLVTLRLCLLLGILGYFLAAVAIIASDEDASVTGQTSAIMKEARHG